jgi:hypothetical protein
MQLRVLTRVFTDRSLPFIFMLFVTTGIESQTVLILGWIITPGVCPSNSTSRHFPYGIYYYYYY